MQVKRDNCYELMAPAGSYEALAAAIRAGADSVYFGVDKLNMRMRSASAFSLRDLRRIARICRFCGVKSYLTLNTLIYDEDLPVVREICAAAAAARVDAVIAMDIAVVGIAREMGLKVHMSVQANISNSESLRFYSEFADVIVLARELTLDQISAIHSAIVTEDIRGPSGNPVRLEVFAHGALCVAVSGKCHMSLGLYNTSANRGACYQPCRRRYNVTDAETGAEMVLDNQYVMSPKDLCTIEHLNLLADVGVRVFKIEGRGRSAHYVATVVGVYRRMLDDLQNGAYTRASAERAYSELERVFNRGFWSGGYYCGEKLGEWSGASHTQATRRRVQLGTVSNYFSRIGVMEFQLLQQEFSSGAEMLVEGPTTGVVELDAVELRAGGSIVDVARKGDLVTVAVPRKVRRNDKVFWLEDVSS